MKLENSFTVDAPAEAAWDLLMDVPRIVPCMPGAALDEVVDDSHWKATMQVKLGPIGLTFATDVERTEVDEGAKRVVLQASARDVRNRGRAEVTGFAISDAAMAAQCLQVQLAAAPEEAAAATAAQAKPVGGLGLFFGALRRKLARLFRRRQE